jgi:hypothetical protein
MRSLFFYYLFAMIIPAFLMLSLLHFNFKEGFIVTLALFIFLYRPLLDSKKLFNKGVMKRAEIWKLVIGYGHIKWFKELYLER